MDRRGFLKGVAAGSTGAALPGLGHAAGADPMAATAARLRGGWATHRAQLLDGMFQDRPAARHEPISEVVHHLGDGLGALSALKELEALDVEDQVHPEIQSLIVDAAGALGGAVQACRALLQAYLDGHGERPDGEASLRAGLRSLRFSLRDWRTTLGRQNQLEQTLLDLEQETAPGALRRRARRQLRRLEKTERLAAQLHASWGQTGVLEVRDPRLEQRVRAGREKWGARGVIASEQEEPSSVRIVLGVLVMGLGVVGGGYIFIVGVCTTACGSAAGILIMLLGLAICGLAVWAGIRIIRGPRRSRALAVGAGGWVDAGVRRGPGQGLLVEARGRLRSAAGWSMDPDGNGTASGSDAPLPGAPLGGLIARLGDELRFIGVGGRIPAGTDAPLELTINHPPGIAGHYEVVVTALAADADG